MIQTGILVALQMIFWQATAQVDTLLPGTFRSVRATAFEHNTEWGAKTRIISTYEAPTGWLIVDYKPVHISISPAASFTISKTRSKLAYTTTSAIAAKFVELLEYAAEKNRFEKWGAQINQLRSDFDNYTTNVIPTYSSITTAVLLNRKKEEKTKKKPKLKIDLLIKLVFMPETEEQFVRSLELLKEVISNEG